MSESSNFQNILNTEKNCDMSKVKLDSSNVVNNTLNDEQTNFSIDLSNETWTYGHTYLSYGKKWYFKLVPNDPNLPSYRGLEAVQPRGQKTVALMDDYKNIDGKLVVCINTDRGNRLYALFDSYIEFGHYQRNFAPQKRSFFEVIFGEYPQKPHFDIEIKEEDLVDPKLLEHIGSEVLNGVVFYLVQILQEKGIQLDLARDVLIYSSHGSSKKSFHVIVNNYCHYDNKEARRLYDLVFERLFNHINPGETCSMGKKYPNLGKWIDPKVYSSKQQFRILGSQKVRSNRPKILEKVWFYQGNPIEHKYVETPESPGHEMILQLEESLISNTSSCNILPSFLDETNSNNIEGSTILCRYMEDVSMDLAVRALKLCAAKANITINDYRFPYKINAIRGGLVLLKRIRPSRCQICKRIHEYENPYLIIVGSEDVKTVFFDCRRAVGKKLLIGQLGTIVPENQGDQKDTLSSILLGRTEDSIICGSIGETLKANWCTTVLQKLQTIATRNVQIDKSIQPSIYQINVDSSISRLMFANANDKYQAKIIDPTSNIDSSISRLMFANANDKYQAKIIDPTSNIDSKIVHQLFKKSRD